MKEIEETWSFEDVANAHAMIDVLDAAEAEAMERAERAADPNRGRRPNRR